MQKTRLVVIPNERTRREMREKIASLAILLGVALMLLAGLIPRHG